MKKTYWIVAGVAVLIVAAVAYKGRHRLKTMLMGSTPAPTSTEMMASPEASPEPGVVMTKTSAKGSYLADAKGMTLYTFDKDKMNTATCTGACAQLWPGFVTATAPAGSMPDNVSSFKLANGSYQYTWKGMPLYYYSKDKAAGDTNGDGFGGVWHIVKQ